MLPRGWMRKVQQKLEAWGHSYHPSYLSQVKNGYYRNEHVERALLEVAEEAKGLPPDPIDQRLDRLEKHTR